MRRRRPGRSPLTVVSSPRGAAASGSVPPFAMPVRAVTVGAARAALAVALLAAGLLAGCRAEEPPAEEPEGAERAALVVLSERDEEVVGDLLEAWSAASGIEIEVRYGAPGELAAAALAGDPPEEPTVLLSRDAVALGGLAAAGRALPLPVDLTAAIPGMFVDPERRWVGLTGRARVIVYDPQRLGREDLPSDLAGFGEPARRGRFGLAPASRSFRIHLAAYRALHGPEAFGRLLERLAATEPQIYPDGEALVRAVREHEIDFALVDHPHLWQERAERQDEPAPAGAADGEGDGGDAAPPPTEELAMLPLPAADASGYLGVAGAAVLAESAAAIALVRHLVGAEAQARLAAATSEYPLLPAAEPPAGLLPLAELDLAQIDYRAVAAALPETEAAIEESALTN